jgi:hypothetical protein
MGFIQGEAQESLSTKMSFLRVAQKLWPIKRPDNIEGQHVNITQLPFNIDINQDMELSLDYHILIHFEKPQTHFNQDQILKKILLRLQEMEIETSNDIGEPVAVLCYTNTKAWSGMVKIHLKKPEEDGIVLLKGTRIFAL